MFIWVKCIQNSKNINKQILWLLGVGVTFYYDLKPLDTSFDGLIAFQDA